MSDEYKLPTYEQCEELEKFEDVTVQSHPIERFIIDNEPAGDEHEVKFREQLLHVILHSRNVGALLARLEPAHD